MSDADLVRQTLAGQNAAFEELVRRWSPRTLAVCHSRVGSRHAAEDLAQESLLRAFRGLASLAEPAKFGAWLKGIAVRTCLDWLKARQTSQVPFTALGPNCKAEDLAAEQGSCEEALDRREAHQRLLVEVQLLPEEYRETLLLYYYQDVTYRELAEQLGVSPATVNARLTKARALLRERLSGICDA
jgi:RNA polymerase sigma-70 factor (ECF subfamily)